MKLKLFVLGIFLSGWSWNLCIIGTPYFSWTRFVHFVAATNELFYSFCPYRVCFHLPYFVLVQYNYGGIQAKMQNATSEGSSDGDNDIDIVSSWNIAEYLPKATQVSFF